MEEEAEAEDIPGVEILSFMQIDNLFKKNKNLWIQIELFHKKT